MIGRALLAAAALSVVVASEGTAVIVTDDDRRLPAACRPLAVAATIERFTAAYNRGDRDAARFFLPEEGWYSVTDRRGHFATHDSTALAGYFARRHRQGERLRLREVIVGYAHGKSQLEFRLDRRADDLTTTRATGKGALDCDRGRIIVWSMGAERGGRICPRTPRRTSQAVACVRHWR